MARSREATANDFDIPEDARSERPEASRNETLERAKEMGAAALGIVGEKSRAAFERLSTPGKEAVARTFERLREKNDQFRLWKDKALYEYQERSFNDPARRILFADRDIDQEKKVIENCERDYEKLRETLGDRAEFREKMEREKANAEVRLQKHIAERKRAEIDKMHLDHKRTEYESARSTISGAIAERMQARLAPFEEKLAPVREQLEGLELAIKDHYDKISAFQNDVLRMESLKNEANSGFAKEAYARQIKEIEREIREGEKMADKAKKQQQKYQEKFDRINASAEPWREKVNKYGSMAKANRREGESDPRAAEKAEQERSNEDKREEEMRHAREYVENTNWSWEKKQAYLKQYRGRLHVEDDDEFPAGENIPEGIALMDEEEEEKGETRIKDAEEFAAMWNSFFGAKGYKIDERKFRAFLGTEYKKLTLREFADGCRQYLSADHKWKQSIGQKPKRFDTVYWSDLEKHIQEFGNKV